jgi:hypothetical protein
MDSIDHYIGDNINLFVINYTLIDYNISSRPNGTLVGTVVHNFTYDMDDCGDIGTLVIRRKKNDIFKYEMHYWEVINGTPSTLINEYIGGKMFVRFSENGLLMSKDMLLVRIRAIEYKLRALIDRYDPIMGKAHIASSPGLLLGSMLE